MKFNTSVIMLIMMMCWALQSAAQPTRADIRYALKQLGFIGGAPNSKGTITPVVLDMPSVSNVDPHKDHFHIYLQPPKIQSIEMNARLLVTDSLITSKIINSINKDNQDVCIPAEHPNYRTNPIEATFDPIRSIAWALEDIYGIPPQNNGSVKVLEQPKHGKLISTLVDEPIQSRHKLNTYYNLLSTDYRYLPDNSFKFDPQSNNSVLGEDYVKVEVTLNNKKFILSYTIKIVTAEGRECESDETDALVNNNFSIKINIEDINEDFSDLASDFSVLLSAENNLNTYIAEMVSTSYTYNVLNHIQISFADITGTALGETNGEGERATITLDTDAAGHGWFVDSTPEDSSEYLATSNPNEWVARAGSKAEGKMDMLSVLLHEYGHALGLEHSPDNHDYMATTLTPGMRRLPSVAELSLMAQLVAEQKAQLLADANSQNQDQAGFFASLRMTGDEGNGQSPLPTLPLGAGFGITFLGLMRRNSSTSSIFAAPTAAQYDIAANPTLTNGNLNSNAGWETAGKVTTDSGGAELSEITSSQTRLNQVFVVGPQDRYLSFTLAGIALDDALSGGSSSGLGEGPSDAFEVGLLDANTGVSLAQPIAMTHTDALLNLQANGNELAAQGVMHVINADGSRTYVVDLVGIAAGTAVNLSFDLIGFGKDAASTQSHVTVRDVKLLGMPITQDDVATGVEDTAMQIIALANDSNAQQIGFAPVVVTAPTHGTVMLNADGSFSYTPEANYFGDDSFTYKVSNGAVDSNVSTVNLTVTAVNDAPLTGDFNVTTAEDTAITLDLLAQASDVEGSALAVVIVSQPSHGDLVQNADGSYTYTPNANFNGEDSFTYQVNDGELGSSIATVSLVVTAVNDAPVATPRNLTLDEDTALNVDLLAGTTDVEGDVLTTVIVNAPQHGSLVINANGSYTYTPEANYFGSDSFSYLVNDSQSNVNGLDSKAL